MLPAVVRCGITSCVTHCIVPFSYQHHNTRAVWHHFIGNKRYAGYF